jgi:glucosamine--fructose-6-phosphate aminotransferase (isomerizing)
MCGIIGIISHTDVVGGLLSGLERLEYRGYDSAGIAVVNSDGIAVRRSKGPLRALRATHAASPVSGNIGIAHTRWATHGVPSERNAHPHCVGRVAVVHNGIVENSSKLRTELAAAGRAFASETDTEVIPHLIEVELARGASPLTAVQRAVSRLDGAYAIAVVFADEPNLMFAARHGSPLVIGYGEPAADGSLDMFVGSDATALAPLTRRISYLEEGDVAILSRVGALVFDRRGADVERAVADVSSAADACSMGAFPHFMLKEIHEQPAILARLNAAWHGGHADAPLRRGEIPGGVDRIDRIVLIACGTSHHAAMIAKYWFEHWTGLPAEAEIASEFRYREKALAGRELAVFISQSGETADTIAALTQVRGRVAARLAVVNVATSSMAREADHAIDIEAGPEIGVASTKAFTAQLFCLASLAIEIGRQRQFLSRDDARALIRDLEDVPRLVAETLALEPLIVRHARWLAPSNAALFMGRGVCYPIALEGALKLKEIGYVKTDGYAAGELKHGPIALVEDGYPVVALAPSGPLLEKTLSNCAEVEARGGSILLLTDAPQAGGRRVICLPRTRELLSCFTTVVALQLLSYHAAVLRDCDVDRPRNLAKSVTVE